MEGTERAGGPLRCNVALVWNMGVVSLGRYPVYLVKCGSQLVVPACLKLTVLSAVFLCQTDVIVEARGRFECLDVGEERIGL